MQSLQMFQIMFLLLYFLMSKSRIVPVHPLEKSSTQPSHRVHVPYNISHTCQYTIFLCSLLKSQKSHYMFSVLYRCVCPCTGSCICPSVVSVLLLCLNIFITILLTSFTLLQRTRSERGARRSGAALLHSTLLHRLLSR